MFLNYIHLKNFRNFFDQRIDFNSKFNLLIGKNAQGKTNVLEAVYLFATGKSFRTSEFRDMMRRGSMQATVHSGLEISAGRDDLRLMMDVVKKEIFRNGKRVRAGNSKGLCAVLFAPEEILLIRRSPHARRKYVDTLIAQVFPAHGTLSRKYSKIVSQRNGVLQIPDMSAKGRDLQLKPWDAQLIKVGAKLIFERSRWCEKLNALIPQRYAAIAPADGDARFIYRPHIGDDFRYGPESEIGLRIETLLHERRGDEVIRRVSLVGPHRDDFRATIGENEVQQFGSQGQHRSFMLALKMSEVDFIRGETGETPVLLLDDVASELDDDRNEFLFEYLRNIEGQVFMTATDDSEIRLLPGSDLSIFDVVSGGVAPRKQRNIRFCADTAS